jgi:lysophospholipase L1-like esterase
MRGRSLVSLGLLTGLLVAGCSQAPRHSAAPVDAPPARVVYAALGASETVGVGTDDPTRQSFPQRLFQRLPRSAVLYNFGLPGETTAAALSDELPPALAVQPTLVTVWFNVDDMAAGVAAADYETRLDRLVSALRRDGSTRVLLANSLPLDRLPAYAACRPDPPPGAVKCPLAGATLPPPEELEALVAAYNAAVARVAALRGAVVVDLFAQAAGLEQHPEYVSADGFHPSAEGAAAIAAAFAAQLGTAATG